jgi:hypothetical protein
MDFRAIVDSQLVKGLKARGIERPFRRWLGVHPVQPRDAVNGNGSGHGGPTVESIRILRGPEDAPEGGGNEDS